MLFRIRGHDRECQDGLPARGSAAGEARKQGEGTGRPQQEEMSRERGQFWSFRKLLFSTSDQHFLLLN